jgi:hypothetical protein
MAFPALLASQVAGCAASREAVVAGAGSLTARYFSIT